MSTASDQLSLLAPALAFLLAAVPLAHLFGRLGFFDAVARRVSHRVAGVWPWWVLAAATTAVLNLDATVVLLTPLYIRVARQRGEDPLVLAVVPFLLANLASSVLPVSNLTNLIAAEQVGIHTGDLVRELGPASLAMVGVGFVVHRRWARTVRPAEVVGTTPTEATFPPAGAVVPGVGPGGGARAGAGAGADPAAQEPSPPVPTDDGRALVVGGLVVVGLLAAFVLGPVVGVEPWEAVVVADVVLALVCRTFPWRTVPVATAAAVAVLGVVVALVVPGDHLGALVDRPGGTGALLGSLTAVALTAAVDNLPALLALLQGIDHPDAAIPVLLGVNAGAVLTPIGSLANLLWMRTARGNGLAVPWRRTLALGVRLGGPPLAVGIAVLTLQRALGA